MGLTDGIHLVDEVVAEMIDCTQIPEPQSAPLPAPMPTAESPVRQAMDATLAQTGADPPPVES